MSNNIWFQTPIVALDIDGTYGINPSMWDRIIDIMIESGYTVHVVTMRYPTETCELTRRLISKNLEIFYTSRKQKREFMESNNINVDIWIDDYPEAIVA